MCFFLLLVSFSFIANPVKALTITQTTVRIGQLININGTVYLVESNGLYGFPSLAIFNSWGYSFSNISGGNSAEIGMPMASVVPMRDSACNSILDQINNSCSSLGQIRPGALINKNGTIYLVDQSGLYGFPSASIFFSWNLSFSDIVTANNAENNLPFVDLMQIKHVGCNTPLDQINNKCSFFNNSNPVISQLSPASGTVGTIITIKGSGFTSTGNTIKFGIGSFIGQASADGQTLQFTVPSTLAPYCAPNMACPQFVMQVTPANYNVSVTNNNGTSNTEVFTVTGLCGTGGMMCATPLQ